LTILIPFFKHSKPQRLEETLLSVLENSPEKIDILVLNGNRYEDPYRLAEEGVRFLEFSEPCNLVECINRGIDAASAPIVQVLMSGVEVSEGWLEAALSHFEDPEVAIVSPLVYDRRTKKFPPQIRNAQIAYCCGGHLKRHQIDKSTGKWIRLAPHATSPFLRRSAIREAGWLNTNFGLQLSYVDLSMTLHVLGWESAVATKSRVFSRRGLLPASPPFQWAKQSEQLYWRWADWGGWCRSLGRHFWGNLAEGWSLFPRLRMWKHLVGRLAGLGHYGAHRLRREQLQERMERVEQEREMVPTTLPFDIDTDPAHSKAA
jgi:hypothetical protein